MHGKRNETKKKSLVVGVTVAFVAAAVIFGLVAAVAPLAQQQSALAQSDQSNSTAATNGAMTSSSNGNSTTTAPANNNNATSTAPAMNETSSTTAKGNATATTTSPSEPAAKQGRLFVAQKTGISAPDPLPGHSMHQLVMVVPPRADGKIWDGDISWTSSEVVEVVILHMYNNTGVDDKHGEPLNADLPGGGGKVAITLFKEASNTPAAGGSTHFTGSALAFHTLSGKPFAVTYTVKAVAYEAQR